MLWLGGCANMAVSVKVPDTIGQNGVLVGQLGAGAIAERNELQPKISKGTEKPVLYQDAVKNNIVTMPLEPGDYTLERVQYSYNMGNSTVTQWFPLNLKFRIKAGEVTNLGLLAMVPNPLDKERFGVRVLDNSADMEQHLQKNYVSLYQSLSDKTVHTVTDGMPDKYSAVVGMDKLDEVRRQLVLSELAPGKSGDKFMRDLKQGRFNMHYKTPTSENYVMTALGSMGKIERDAGGKITDVKILPTNTLEDLDKCTANGERALCLLEQTKAKGVFSSGAAKTKKYLLAQGDKIEAGQVDVDVFEKSIWLPGKNQITYADEYMNIFTSLDNGHTWSSYKDAAQKQPIEYGSGSEKISYVEGKDGYYIYSRNLNVPDRRIVYSPFGKTDFSHLAFPGTSDALSQLYETDAGLYASSINSGFTTTIVLFFKPAGSQAWQKTGEVPKGCTLQLPRWSAGINLKALCNGKEMTASADAGRSWVKQ